MKRKSAATAAAHLPQPSPSTSRALLVGAIVRFRPGTEVLLLSPEHGEVVCRLPWGVNATWLAAALALGQVEAEGTWDPQTGSGSIWALFPTEEQARIVPPHVEVNAGETLSFRCGKASVSMEKDGSLHVKGRDVVTRGSRSTRISGGTVRIN